MTNFNISGFVQKIPCKYCNKDLRPRAIVLIEIVWLNVEEFASHLQKSTTTVLRYINQCTRIGNVSTVAVINWPNY